MVTIYVVPRCKLCHAVVGCYGINAAPTGLRTLHEAVTRHLKAGHYIDSSKTVPAITGCQCQAKPEIAGLLSEMESLAAGLMEESRGDTEDAVSATRLCVAKIRTLVARHESDSTQKYLPSR
jgi:hypothetical protein